MMTTRSMKKKAEAVSPETNKTATENELNITKLTPLGKTRKAMKVEKELNEDDSVATFDFNYEEGNKKTPNVQIKNENFDELLKKRESELDKFIDNVKTTEMPKLRQKVLDGDISTNEYDNTLSNIRSEIAQLAEDLENLKLESMKQQKVMEDIRVDMITRTNDCQDDIQRIERDNERYVKDILKNRQKVNDHEQDIRKMKSQLTHHELNLNLSPNPTGNMSSTAPWMIQQDEDKYPILKRDKNSHWSKFTINLKDIKLESDSLMDIQKFWSAINTAFTATLNANSGLPRYEDLSSPYSIQDDITPPIGHTRHTDGKNAYENFARVIRDFLLKDETIKNTSAPNAYKNLIANQLEQDGFKLLTTIITLGSPQLGGIERNLIKFVDNLKITDGEQLVEFYLRAKKMYQEITLQKDQTGQDKRLTRQFLDELNKVSDYKTALHNISKDIRRFFRNPQWLNLLLPHNIDAIYDELDISDVMKTIITDIEEVKDPIVNAGNAIDTDNENENCENPTVNSSRMSRNEVKQQSLNKNSSQPIQNNSYQQKKKDWEKKHNIDCTCNACGFSTRELYRKLKFLHNGDPKQCPFRGPAYNNDKDLRERINQYNLKNKSDKVTPNKDRLEIPPQQPSIPKINHVNNNVDGDENQTEDIIDQDYYSDIDLDDDDTLPQPYVKSSKIHSLSILPTYRST